MPLWTALSQHITDATGVPFQARRRRSVGGGCINHAYVAEDGRQRYFVKTNTLDKAAMFAAEAAGLQAILAGRTLRAPQPICHGVADGRAYLVLEFIAMENGGGHSAALLGEQLAAMHRVTASRYGWEIDNAIGATPQINTWRDDWIRFYGEHRLRFQLDLAARNGYPIQAKGEKLIDRLPSFFTSYQAQPALLHGDLWGGNWGEDSQGKPVIFDPALYYGDREADLAMTELFGGFPAPFYVAYAAAHPLDAGYATRKDLYNLYHILNHFNLFGGGYGGQAARMIDRLLAELQG
ncbi:MAG: fructosamine kinase family protein [Hydrogenophilales bacterium]|nr:fructosamine kinase family protein [Hydrogenophilales bacterium]